MSRIRFKFLSRAKGQRPGGLAWIADNAGIHDHEGKAILTAKCNTLRDFQLEVERLKRELDSSIEMAKTKFQSQP